MRRIALMILIFIIFTMSVNGAKNKEINILAAVGGTDAVFEDAMIDLGLELQLTRLFYFQVVANSHLEDNNRYYYPYYGSYGGIGYGGNSVAVGLNFNALHGISTYGLIKGSVARRLEFYAKGGLNITFYTRYDSISGFQSRKESTTGFGAGFGTGVDYKLTEKIGLVVGTTYKFLFKRQSEVGPENSRIDWFKYFIGLSYKIK
jgi:hypothetical protein